MREEDSRMKEGAALWRRVRPDVLAGGWSALRDEEAPEALLLAAYLDGRLAEDEAARLEARLAVEPALLDELLALREAVKAGPETAPPSVIARAQGLRAASAATASAATLQRSVLDRLLGISLRPAVPALASLALLLACAGAFELGRHQAEQLRAPQTLAASDSDLPVDLLMGGLL